MDMNDRFRQSVPSDSSSQSGETEQFQDSIGRRRRHAVYFRRPSASVWRQPVDDARCPQKPWRDADADVDADSSVPLSHEAYCEHFDLLEPGDGRPRPCFMCQADMALDCPELGIPEADLPSVSLNEERWKLRARSWLQESLQDAIGSSASLSAAETKDSVAVRNMASSEINVSQANASPRRQGLGVKPSLRQRKAELCTRLKFMRDVRAARDETWAIQEGSLVVCIDPIYTDLDFAGRALPDEFQIRYGDVYVVCRIYADLWALCAQISFPDSTLHQPCAAAAAAAAAADGGCGPGIAGGATRLSFLPLCAVTLAPNLSGFIERCASGMARSGHSANAFYPGNGLRVKPPERCHSLHASKQLAQSQFPIQLPALFHDSCAFIALNPLAMDHVPLDSTVRQLLSDMLKPKERSRHLQRQPSLRRFWRSSTSADTCSSDTDDGSDIDWSRRSAFRLPVFHRRTVSRRQRSSRGSLSSVRENLRRLMRTSS